MDYMEESMKGNYAIRSSEFMEHCTQGRKRAFQVCDENDASEEGRKRLTERLDEKEEDIKRRRIECIKLNGLTVTVKCDQELSNLDPTISKLIIHSDSCNETTSFLFPLSVSSLEVQNSCLRKCGSMVMKEMNKLHSLRIGARCFSRTERGEAASLSNVFSLSLCPTLQVLVIGNFSFSV